MRKDKREKKISLHQQHEILATSWKSLMGDGVVEKIMGELAEKNDDKDKKDEEKGGGGLAKGKGEDEMKGHVDYAGNDDDDDNDVLERWFSWAGMDSERGV